MTQIVLTRAQSRRVDQLAIEHYGISGLVLMENAGRGVADRLCALLTETVESPATPPSPVVICCGKGNNAGDGFVIARHLDLRGIGVRVLLWADPNELTGDAAVNCCILQKTKVPIEVFGPEHDADRLAGHLDGASWIVDALLGTGACGEPRPPLDAVIRQLNASGTPILAVDLPSGLDCDTGEATDATVRATVTCTFVAAKPGLLMPAADPHTGTVHVLDIGAPEKLVDYILAEG